MRKSTLSVCFLIIVFSITACVSANPVSVLASNATITKECSNVLGAVPVCEVLSDCLCGSLTPADVSIVQESGNEYIEVHLFTTDILCQIQIENISLTIPPSVVQSWIGKSNSSDTFVAVPNVLTD